MAERKTAEQPLTGETLLRGVRLLCRRDADLARVVRDYGPPPLWSRPQGFPTLIQIILEQQVSLASAKAAFDRLLNVASPLTPERLLMLDDATLKRAGFSRQKTAYARGLACAILEGRFDINGLGYLSDAAAKRELIKVKGIGEWTADIYLLMALGRKDTWPAGDLALCAAMQAIKRLDSRPTPTEITIIAERWRPWRAVAARILWHYYLSR